MEPSLIAAREAVQTASEVSDDSAIHEQLDSIDDGLATLIGPDAPPSDAVEGDRLEELERQLVGIGDDADGRASEHIETARDHIDAFRREYASEWE